MTRRAKSADRDPQPSLFDAPPSAEQPSGEQPRSEQPVPAADEPASDTPAPAAHEQPAVPAEAPAYSVSELTNEIQARVGALGRLRVEGEVSAPKRAASGHVYFDLKDESARISCVLWRSVVARALRFELEEGMQVVVRGRLDVYPPRGSYSLVVERVEPLGIGALLAKLEKLKLELRKRGWFDRARELPALPRCIGVVTSRDGAALRDFLRTRSLRWPGYPLRLCHSAVQGPGAAEGIADALRRLDRSGVDLIVVCRGGGSLEDLWCFNEEVVAQAIWEASVPVVSGVGHESDTTLADLVADHRAHTPTDAAQTVIPDRRSLDQELVRWGNYLVDAMDGLLVRRGERLAELAARRVLRGADWILDDRARDVQSAAARLRSAVAAQLSAAENRLQRIVALLQQRSPRARIDTWQGRLAAAGERLRSSGTHLCDPAQKRLELATARLEATSPLAVLARGYSVTRARGETAPLVDAGRTDVGEELETRLARGKLVSRVVSRELADEPGDEARDEDRA